MNKFIIPAGIAIIAFGIFFAAKFNMDSAYKPNSETRSQIAIPIADSDYVLDNDIPANYIPVPGRKNVFMIVDENGKVLKYQKRELQSNGAYVFSDINQDIPDDYVSVAGLSNVYKTTKNGIVKYYKYIRNSDNSFAFLEVDSNGNEYFNTDATNIPSNYIWVTGNTYAVYDEHNVIILYVERYLDEGKYKWRKTDKPLITGSGIDSSGNISESKSNLSSSSEISSNMSGNGDNLSSNNNSVSNNSDGTMTKTSSYTETKSEGTYLITYKTTITYVYDKAGNLLSTQKDGPKEISRTSSTSASTVDKSKIKNSLSEEWYRVCNGTLFNTQVASDMLNILNAERISSGLSPVTMNTESDLYKIAQIKCKDMVIYNHSTSNSPMYGTISDMISLFGLNYRCDETIIKLMAGSANDDHLRIQNISQIRDKRMSPSLNSIAIVIISENGMDYLYEAYIK